MDPISAIETCLEKYADFSGRARRAEFWWFLLLYSVAPSVAAILSITMLEYGIGEPLSTVAVWLPRLITFGLIIPMLAVSARRMHDIGRSAWWLLLYLTGPFVIILLIFCLIPTKKEPNKYGPYIPAEGVEA